MKRIISCVLSLVLLVSISATPILAATKATQEPLKITERADRSNEKYTLEDLAAMRLAVYGILEEKFRSKQEETNAPISRPEAVKLLYRTFSSKDSTVYEKAPFRDVSEAYSRTTEIVEPIYPLSEQDNDLPLTHFRYNRIP